MCISIILIDQIRLTFSALHEKIDCCLDIWEKHCQISKPGAQRRLDSHNTLRVSITLVTILSLLKITHLSLFPRAVSVGEYGDCNGTLLQISSLVVGDMWELQVFPNRSLYSNRQR